MMAKQSRSIFALLACLYFASVVVGCADAEDNQDDEIDIPFFITIEPTIGESFQLTVEPADTLEEVKRMILLHQNGKVPIRKQELYLLDSNNERTLLSDNEATLKSLKIEHGAELQLVVPIPETATAKNTYFGVDANDQEAVRRRQKELGEEKFQEIFGDDVDLDHIKFHEDAPQGPKLHETVKGAFKWLYNVVTGKKEPVPEPQETTQQPS